MKILVTGAEGFVGKAICEQMNFDGHTVLRLTSPRKRPAVKDSENIFRADITNKKELEELDLPQKIDVVIHCAGLAHQFGETSYRDFEKVNVGGSYNVCEMAVRLKARHFIQISSVSVYGDETKKSGRITDEDDVCSPGGFYGLSKLEGEKAVRKVCTQNKIGLTILRPVTVIGEGDRGNVAKLIGWIERRRFVWIGRGTNRKSLIYKRDVGRACSLLVRKKDSAAAEIFNLSAEAVQMSEIVGKIAACLERQIPEFHISAELVQNLLGLSKFLNSKKIERAAEKLQKWLTDDVYSAERIYRKYGFKPETDVLDALGREVAWYENNETGF